jgi:sialidase-1
MKDGIISIIDIGRYVMQKFTVSRDDSIYEAWPDVALTDSGKLVCVFSECNHHGDRYKTSVDRGRTWSEKHYLTAQGKCDAFYNCARISKLSDGRLSIICDLNSFLGWDCFKAISYDGGESWQGVYNVPLSGCHRPTAGILKMDVF